MQIDESLYWALHGRTSVTEEGVPVWTWGSSVCVRCPGRHKKPSQKSPWHLKRSLAVVGNQMVHPERPGIRVRRKQSKGAQLPEVTVRCDHPQWGTVRTTKPLLSRASHPWQWLLVQTLPHWKEGWGVQKGRKPWTQFQLWIHRVQRWNYGITLNPTHMYTCFMQESGRTKSFSDV